MHGLSHLCLNVTNTGISEMKTPNSATQRGPIPRRGTVRISRDLTHSGSEDLRIAALAFSSPPFDACSEDLREVSSRRQ
jgi:hypothetical protein